jgi:hypothetical protein
MKVGRIIGSRKNTQKLDWEFKKLSDFFFVKFPKTEKPIENELNFYVISDWLTGYREPIYPHYKHE